MTLNISQSLQFIIQMAENGDQTAIKNLAGDAMSGFPISCFNEQGEKVSLLLHKILYEHTKTDLWNTIHDEINKLTTSIPYPINDYIAESWILDAAANSDYHTLRTLLVDVKINPHFLNKIFFQEERSNTARFVNGLDVNWWKYLNHSLPTTSPLIEAIKAPVSARKLRELLSLVSDVFCKKDNNSQHIMSEKIVAKSIFLIWSVARNKPGVILWCEEQCKKLYQRMQDNQGIKPHPANLFSGTVVSCLENLPRAYPLSAIDEYLKLASLFSDGRKTQPLSEDTEATACLRFINTNHEHLCNELANIANNMRNSVSDQCVHAKRSLERINYARNILFKIYPTAPALSTYEVIGNIKKILDGICSNMSEDYIGKRKSQSVELFNILQDTTKILPTNPLEQPRIDASLARISRQLLLQTHGHKEPLTSTVKPQTL